MLLNSVGGMNLYEKERDTEFSLYQKAHPGMYCPDFDPMSFEMTKSTMQLQFQQQQKVQHEQRRERKKLPVEEHEHWVALVWTDSNSKPHVRSSSNLRFCKASILEEGLPKFTHYVHQVKSGGFSFDEGMPFDIEQNRSTKSQFTASRESRPKTGDKRKKRSNDNDSSDDGRRTTSYQHQDDDPNEPKSSDVHLRADATEDWRKWFYNAFRAVQQQACRTIAKEWIKTIHPKKQSTHPYNGKNPKTGEKGDPSSTKPPYWPAKVKHKEPDHINKEDRTQLLVHLLMSTPHLEMSISGEPRSTKEITAEMLKEPLDTKKHENVNKELLKRFHIVDSIIYVRTQLESYEDGGLAGDSIISAPDYSGYNRGTRAEDESDDVEEDDMGDAVETNDTNDETDGRTDLASEDTDYVLVRPSGLQGPNQEELVRRGEGRKRSRRRHGSRVDDSQSASFVSTASAATVHPMAPQHMGLAEASPISPEWQMLRHGRSDQHTVPPPHMYAPDQMWRHSVNMQMQAPPFPEHGLISPPPQHHMNGGGLPVGGVAMSDGRFMNGGPYYHPPMHSGPQYMRHAECTDVHDPRCMPVRSTTPQEMYLGHPTPPVNPSLDRGYY